MLDQEILDLQPETAAVLKDHRTRQKRKVLLLIVLAGIAVTCLFANVLAGPSSISASRLVGGLWEPGSLSAVEQVILFELRLPSACLAFLVGAALAVSGVEIQTVLDNPLASPFTLGISSAAAFGASIAIVAGMGFPFIPVQWLVPGNAFAFAMLAIVLLQVLNKLKGGGPQTLVLFGIAMVFAFSALLSLMQLFASAQAAQMIVFWTMGNVDQAEWVEVLVLALLIVLIFPWSFLSANRLTALRFGADRATSLGVDVDRLRLLAQVRISLLTGMAVALTGTIAFVGLVGPHIARMLLGENHRLLLPASAITGAALLSAAAVVSKVLIPGVSIPVGIVTAIVGVPVFVMVILTRTSR